MLIFTLNLNSSKSSENYTKKSLYFERLNLDNVVYYFLTIHNHPTQYNDNATPLFIKFSDFYIQFPIYLAPESNDPFKG